MKSITSQPSLNADDSAPTVESKELLNKPIVHVPSGVPGLWGLGWGKMHIWIRLYQHQH